MAIHDSRFTIFDSSRSCDGMGNRQPFERWESKIVNRESEI